MRWAAALVMLAGCRAVFGLEPPERQVSDAPAADSPLDVRSTDGPPFSTCTNDTNLVACFDFEGSVIDQAPSPNAVTAANLAYATGISGQAVTVVDSSRIQIQDSLLLDIPAVTMEAWIYETQPTIGSRAGVWDVDGQYGLFIKDGMLSCNAGMVFETGSINLNTWTHVACTAENGNAFAYINGALAGAAVYSAAIATAPANGGEIGGNAPDGMDRFVGKIDQLRVYRVGRTAAQICSDAGKTGC